MDPYEYFKIKCKECPYHFHDGINCKAHDCIIIEEFLKDYFNELRLMYGNMEGFKGTVKLTDNSGQAPRHCRTGDKLDPGVWCEPSPDAAPHSYPCGQRPNGFCLCSSCMNDPAKEPAAPQPDKHFAFCKLPDSDCGNCRYSVEDCMAAYQKYKKATAAPQPKKENER